MDRGEEVAIAATAPTIAVPESVPRRGFVPMAGLVPMAMVMLAEEVVTVLPKVSWTVTWIAGASDAPAVAFDGATVNVRRFAAAGLMVKALEVAPVSGTEAAVSV